jgi:hypothetical protein
MELWIRSQSKEDLVKVNGKIYIIPYNDEYFSPIVVDTFEVGSYRTKERALEVLDEIQSIIIGKYAISLDMKSALSEGITPKEAEKMLLQMAVYEMPKD